MALYNHYTNAVELIIQTIVNMKELPPDLPELVHEGPLLKKGQRNSWKERWFVLFSNYQMLYYLDQNESNKATNLCGWIDLHDVWMINAASTEESIINHIPGYMKTSNDGHLFHGNKSKKKKSLEIGRKNKNKNNNSLNNEQHEMILITSTQTFQLKNNDGDSFLKWILYLNNFVFNNKAKILYQGWLYKKSERKRRQWKKRWIVIEDYTKAITYYEDDTRSSFRHYIALQDIVDDGIDINNKIHKSYKHGFTMTTLERNYTFATQNKQEMEQWVSLIKKGRIEVLQEIEEEEKNNDGDQSATTDYSDFDSKDSDDTDSDLNDTTISAPSFGKKKLTIAALTDIIQRNNSGTPSVEYYDQSVEEKMEHAIITPAQRQKHQYSQSDLMSAGPNDMAFDFDPQQLEWLKEHNMLHTGHLSARKNRSLNGHDLQRWEPPTEINMAQANNDNNNNNNNKDLNFTVRPWYV